MNNVNKLLGNGRFSVADDGFSARVMAAIEGQQAPTPIFVPRRISVWKTYYWPAIGTAVGVVCLGLLFAQSVDLNQLSAKWYERTEILAGRLTLGPILAPMDREVPEKQEPQF